VTLKCDEPLSNFAFTSNLRRYNEGGAGDDPRVGGDGSISFNEEAHRLAAGGGPAMDAVWDRGALVAIEPALRQGGSPESAQNVSLTTRLTQDARVGGCGDGLVQPFLAGPA
jgi:hypothetical protein